MRRFECFEMCKCSEGGEGGSLKKGVKEKGEGRKVSAGVKHKRNLKINGRGAKIRIICLG